MIVKRLFFERMFFRHMVFKQQLTSSARSTAGSSLK